MDVPSTLIVQVPSSPPHSIATCTSTGLPPISTEPWSSPRPIHDQVRCAISVPSHSSLKPLVSSLRDTTTSYPSYFASHRVPKSPMARRLNALDRADNAVSRVAAGVAFLHDG